MLLLMRLHHSPDELQEVVAFIQNEGLKPHVIPGTRRVVIGVTGNKTALGTREYLAFAGVERAMPVSKPYQLASRDTQAEDTIVEVGEAKFGGSSFSVIAGPCSVESEKQTLFVAQQVKACGAQVLRGGAYKPRTSPYAFQGLGEAALDILLRAKKETGLPVVSEAIDERSLEKVAAVADMVQIGARNMQNYALLSLAGQLDQPVMLKRGLSATIEEWLLAAEYILHAGNSQVVLCERGIRSFDNQTRNLLDIAAVAVVKELSHLPVIVDPSHGTGRKSFVEPMARAALAAGAHGVMVEVHDQPSLALSDGQQALLPDDFASLMKTLTAMKKVLR